MQIELDGRKRTDDKLEVKSAAGKGFVGFSRVNLFSRILGFVYANSNAGERGYPGVDAAAKGRIGSVTAQSSGRIRSGT
jgi:hypothetical protein